MRLEKIKIAGFKSFVDPTTVPIPSHLVGIVGPNGCGKSNVIDAVRWVMGESSARLLRGESMADVIFNGSHSRKPVGQASVELLFDNSSGAAGGQFAQFAQISVRRLVTRDGLSHYFLNATRCRRRDITDLFLGTGLGPRSYSIIEQGMISRLIEARPEDLRMFLEEAAGISKYKERRKETESRIRSTRENLDRLNDVRDELYKQLEHLRRQAAVAERYRDLKEQERQRKAELLALRRRQLEQQLAQIEQELAVMEREREAATSGLRGYEARIEQERTRYAESNEQFNEVQGRFYATTGEIARIEQAMEFIREQRNALEREVQRVTQELEQATLNQQQQQQQLTQCQQELAEEEPQLSEQIEQEQQLDTWVATLEEEIHAAQEEWERCNQQAAAPNQAAQSERSRMNHLEQRDSERRSRRERLHDELQRIETSDNSQLGSELQQRLQGLEQQLSEVEGRSPALQQQIHELRDTLSEQGAALDQQRSEGQRLQGRSTALTTLQQQALGREEQPLHHWLQQQGLSDAPRLVRSLQVTERWQGAVEQLLGDLLQAVVLPDLKPLGETPEQLQQGVIGFIARQPAAGEAQQGEGEWLLAEVESALPLHELLSGVRLAENLQQAWQLHPQLQPGESLITPDGIQLGRNWLRIQRGRNPASGMLEREREISNLAQQLAATHSEQQRLHRAIERDRAALTEAEAALEQVRNESAALNRQLALLRAEWSAHQARREQVQRRQQQVREELAELAADEQVEREELEEARLRLHQALEQIEQFALEREQLQEQRDQQQQRLAQKRQALRGCRDQRRESEVRVGSLRSTREALTSALERDHERLEQLRERALEVRLQVEESGEPLERHAVRLEQQLALQLEVERELGEARSEVERIESGLRERERARSESEQQVARWGERLQEGRIARQELLVRSKTAAEQLTESGFDYPQLLTELSETANEAEWEQQLHEVEGKIRRLGPINLAAIEEFRELEERSGYLEAQHRDISDALETLESAIQKIDRESRGRFKETFEQVNRGLQEKFPQLFGGGSAYLELTGDDLLSTGVTIMARPPGKRNSSIHLLSGGEKALTAVALVFSIFELNPAPFCMLDEVDAPLDDANVGRFCELVKRMSERVQFILISHNKITMEIANQLMGVTMHEPGVSRLVSVDLNEAASLVAEG